LAPGTEARYASDPSESEHELSSSLSDMVQ
jgi:hypothetical protein